MIQLWNPGDEPEREYMTVRKFLAINHRVAKHIPVFYDAELRFESGDRRRPAASYTLSNYLVNDTKLGQHLHRIPRTAERRRIRKYRLVWKSRISSARSTEHREAVQYFYLRRFAKSETQAEKRTMAEKPRLVLH